VFSRSRVRAFFFAIDDFLFRGRAFCETTKKEDIRR
jgi:hypothetical protein